MDDILDVEIVADVEVDVENEIDIEVEVEASGPQGKDGLSAYDIYIQNGGTLIETEWLDSLKGENGKDGVDGATPIKGTDYWTNEDIAAIEEHCNSYIDSQLGTINQELASLTTLGGE